jgi:hypothetical protein
MEIILWGGAIMLAIVLFATSPFWEIWIHMYDVSRRRRRTWKK